MVVQEYPEYHEMMLKNSYKYKDPLLEFTKKVLNQLKIFRNINKDILHEIVYKTVSKEVYEQGAHILKPGDIVNFMFFIESGHVQIYDIIDGNEFVIENLGQGSIVQCN